MSLRRVWILFAPVLTLAACSLIAPPPQTPPVTDGTEPTQAATAANTSTPDGTAQAFLDAWTRSDYAGMFGLIAPTTQINSAPATLDSFTKYYVDSLATMTASGLALEIDMNRIAKTGTTARLPFKVTYNTAVLGHVEKELAMSLQLEGDHWTVVWDPSLLLPELTTSTVLRLDANAPTRASIYDRNGQWLVQSNMPTATLSVIPSLVGDVDQENKMLDVLSHILRMTTPQIQLQYAGYGAGYEQPVAVGDVDQEVLDGLYPEIYNYEAIHVDCCKTGRRDYYNLAPHILGYVSFIQPDQVAQYQALGYSKDALIGQAGLEASQESILAGQRGGTLQACTADGSICNPVASRETQPAQNVYTTIDRNFQVIVQNALEDAYKAGSVTWAQKASGAAAIVVDVHTGEVLAIASYPYFDANAMNPQNGNPLSTDTYFNSLNNVLKPLINRSTQGEYPPGSIFKIITMGATLGSGVFKTTDTYTCNGTWQAPGNDAQDRRDWKEEGHGELTLIEGLTASCDPWFYTMGYQMAKQPNGFDILPKYARDFGLGKLTGIEIDERPGLIPDPTWLQQTKGETWSIDNNVNMAIGQGDVLVTPIQMVMVTAAIANGGTLYQPHLIKSIGLSLDAPTKIIDPQVAGTLPLTPDQIAAIQEGMHGVTSTIDLGTAEDRVGGMQISTAGKTGTAQVSGGQAQPMAWFMGYVPYENPEIAVIVVVENGGQGSTVASPIFRRIVEEWYNLHVFHWPDDWLDPELYEFVQNIGE